MTGVTTTAEVVVRTDEVAEVSTTGEVVVRAEVVADPVDEGDNVPVPLPEVWHT